jgi:hypothetical protein
MQMMKATANYDLQTKVVGLSTDNTNTNFEGLLRKGKGNVLTKIKCQLNINIIGLGCNAHISHNYDKTAWRERSLDFLWTQYEPF